MDAPRCDAVVGMTPSRKLGGRALDGARQCTKDGVVHYPAGPVCRGHHNSGFVSWSQTIGAVSKTLSIAERMRAVLDGDAR